MIYYLSCCFLWSIVAFVVHIKMYPKSKTLNLISGVILNFLLFPLAMCIVIKRVLVYTEHSNGTRIFGWCFSRLLSKNKAIEVELNHFGQFLTFEFFLGWTYKTDHSGFRCCLAVFGLYFSINIYDIRHWDYENNRWVVST